MKKLLYILLFIISGKSVSQNIDNKPSVAVIARSFGDSIIIRWAPNTPMAWKLSNKDGYVVERYTIQKNGKPDKKMKPERKVLTSPSIKPYPLEQWERLAKAIDYGAIAAQAIYGNTFQVTNTKTGGVMQAISLAQELESRFSFALFSADQSLAVAKASGLMLTDKAVTKGEKYVYKIYSLVPSNTYKIDTGYVYIGTDDTHPLPKPVQLKAEFGDRVVMLSWNKVYFDNIFSTYIVERSSDGGKSFTRTSSLPIVNTSPSKESMAEKMYKVDSLPSNNINYVYRIRGITPFEEIGPASDTVAGMGKAKGLQLAPQIISVKNRSDGSISIQWKFPIEYNSKIKEFEVLRSAKANGEYKTLEKINGEKRGYVDKNPKRVNYYIVKLNELNGNQITSFPALGQPIDSIPPSAPEGLEGKIDPQGKLNLKWKRGKEEDLAGYRVYMANSKEEEYTQVTREPLRDTLYIDSINLKTITPGVYYKVMAVDLNSNISSFSEALELKRPDIIPPVPPRFESYKATDTSIIFEWIPSTSIDVVKQILYKREKDSIDWKVIADLTIEKKKFYDLKAKPLVSYEYAIVAVDASGLESEKNQIITLSLIDFGIRGEIKNIQSKIDRLKKEVKLTWEYNSGQPEKFLIYKSTKGEPLRIYKSIKGSERIFIDKSLNMNTEYSYSIRAFYSDGSSSSLSKSINLKY